MAIDVGSAKGYLDLDISGFLNGLKSAQSEADSVSKNIATKIGGNMSKIGGSLTSAGSTLTKNVTLPIAGIGAAGLKVATDFEKGMSEVKAISGTVGKDFDALRNKAIDLGATTAFSAGEVAEAMTEMAKAGWGSQQILDGMNGVLDAAAASGEGLGVVSTIVADTITGFGMAASDSSRVADLLTQAANSGTIGITDLGESFKYIAPVAGAMNLSVEDVTTAISAMSMAGIKGSQAGTSLRTMLTRLVKPNEQVAGAMDELGIEVANADGSMKSLDEIVSNLRNSFDGLTESEKAKYAVTLAGQEGMAGMLSLLNLTEEEYNAIAESMDNSNGVAQETAEVMQDNLQSKVEQLGGSLESLAIKLSDLVIPYVQRFVVWLTNLVEKFTALDPETQKTILKFAGIAAAAGPLLVVFGKLVTGVGGIFTAFGKLPGIFSTVTTSVTKISEGFKLAQAGFSNLGAQASPLGAALGGITLPMLAIVAAIGLVIGAFVSLWNNNEVFRENITAIWEGIKETFNNFTQGIVDRLNSLGFEFESITDVIKAIWQGFCDFLAPVFEGVFQFIADTFKFITDQILNVFDFWIAIFKGDWEGAWEAIKNMFGNIWDFIKNTFENVLNMMKGILDAICGWFGTTWSNTWNAIKTFFENIWNGIVTWFQNTLNGIKTFFSNIWNGITTFFSNILNGIKNTVSNVFNGISNTISNIFNGIKSITTSIWNGIKNAITNPIETAKNAVKKVIDAIKGFFNFKITWPKIPLPHFSIKPKGWEIGDLLKGKIPSLGISWYAKAMNNPMLLTKPTIFGYNAATGQLLGGGEAGSEVVAGTDTLMNMIRRAVHDVINPIASVVSQLAKTSAELGYVTYDGFVKQNQTLEKAVNSGTDGSNGDTFIFNSPKPIDEIEAAKQMKKAKRDLAEGF